MENKGFHRIFRRGNGADGGGRCSNLTSRRHLIRTLNAKKGPALTRAGIGCRPPRNNVHIIIRSPLHVYRIHFVKIVSSTTAGAGGALRGRGQGVVMKVPAEIESLNPIQITPLSIFWFC